MDIITIVAMMQRVNNNERNITSRYHNTGQSTSIYASTGRSVPKIPNPEAAIGPKTLGNVTTALAGM